MKKFLACLVFLFVSLPYSPTYAQGTIRKHLVYFKDKANSPYSISNPSAYLSQAALDRRKRQGIAINGRDLPVSPAYVTGLKNTGTVTVLYTSKWFNAAVVQCDSAALLQVLGLPFVKNSYTLNRIRPAKSQPEKPILVNNQRLSADPAAYGMAYNQAEMIGAPAMHDLGYRGEGMTIAVFDAGFPGVNNTPPFSHLFQNNQIKGTYNFVNRETDVYKSNQHGTMALSCMAAYQPGDYIGTAYKANYYLFLTEDVGSEHPIEEANWLLAAEFADSAGVDVINSSLGYSTFDFPSASYTYADMNGNTAISTRAADFAAATGMLVVTSAGNEGQGGWHYITAPADADSVIAVGAVSPLQTKAGFSSFGPSADGRIKPNLSAQGQGAAVIFSNGQVGLSSGTSFSGPILCGMATGFWQANPNLTNMEVIRVLQQSASQARNPDNELGYGIPNFVKADNYVHHPGAVFNLYPNPVGSGPVFIDFENKLYVGEVQLQIYDRIGRLVDQQVVKKEIRRDLEFTPTSAMGAGLYIMKVSWADQNKTLRLVRLP